MVDLDAHTLVDGAQVRAGPVDAALEEDALGERGRGNHGEQQRESVHGHSVWNEAEQLREQGPCRAPCRRGEGQFSDGGSYDR